MTQDSRPVVPTPVSGASDTALSAERALALLWQQSPDFAFVLMDHAGVVIGWRGAAEVMFGYTEQEVMGRHFDFIFTDEDKALGLQELEKQIAVSVGRSEDDRWHVRKDGARIWVCGSLVALHEQGQHVGYTKVMADRTNLRAQLETMENRLEQAHGAVRARDDFFGRLTHEVRNALGPIRNITELVERKGLVSAELEMPVAVVNRQVAQMERMMGDLTEVVRFGAGKLQLVKEPLDLCVNLAEIAAAVQPDADRKAQSLTVLMPSVPLWIDADKARIHQIVFNLLHNAVKYTPRGGRIWLQCTAETDQAVIKVEDTGIGIAPELLPVIFDLFTQENPHQSEGGFGVGLSLVRDLVVAHGGFVEVRCDGKDRGSEFTVRLPLGLGTPNPSLGQGFAGG